VSREGVLDTAGGWTATSSEPEGRFGWLRFGLVLNAVVALTGLGIKFYETARTADPDFATRPARILNEFCYFTIQSNLLVVVTCLLVAAHEGHLGRALAVARLTALVCITITGIVYYALLTSQNHYTGVALVGDYLCHLVSPVLCIATFVLFGVRGSLSPARPTSVLVYPVAWVVFTLVGGGVTGFYPYDFIDASQNGYLSVFVTIAVIFAIAFALASLARRIDRRRDVPPGRLLRPNSDRLS
jgi:hypothetical protein